MRYIGQHPYLTYLTYIPPEGYIAPMPKVQIWGYRCERCGHEWVPRERHQEPKVCPHCKSPYWDRPRQSAMPSVNKGRRKRS
jgi:DNA-directed RNA polymerase subunit RPC12/RpoP